MLKGWKTLIVNTLTFVGTVFAWPQMEAYLDPQTIVLVIAAINLVLRFFTTTGIGGMKEES